MYKMKYFLLPFSWLYGLITDIRNYLYDKDWFKSNFFAVPIINVGNITVGGTGKSPQVEYLIRLLKDKHKIVTLSRGYGRNTKGFIWADSSANAATIGDEPMQFFQKFGKDISVTVGEKRVPAIEQILQKKADTEVIILDDAFQHRAVKPTLNILLIDYNRPIDEDYPFPAGRLRERRHGAKRADLVVVTKCPENIGIEKQNEFKNRLTHYLQKNTPIFFTKIIYAKPLNCRSESVDLAMGDNILLVSGIANHLPFEAYSRNNFKVDNHLVFKDHHAYTEKDLALIISNLTDKSKVILMTEKDMVKFRSFLNHSTLKNIPLFYLPIAIGFVNKNERAIFDKIIMEAMSISAKIS